MKQCGSTWKISFVIVLYIFMTSFTISFAQEAMPTPSKVFLNEEEVVFEAYHIDGYNYFKLRDLAYVLSETKKQFEVNWAGDSDEIYLISGQAYTANGEEMYQSGETGAVNAQPIQSKLYLDGNQLSPQAYYIDGYHYFKLRDIAEALDFYVGWDEETSYISLNTDQKYVQGTPGTVSAREQDTYELTPINQNSSYFLNKVDGYQIMVPASMQVDMSVSSVRTVLETGQDRIEIYSQKVGGSTGFSAASYKVYSNQFINDTSVYTTLSKKTKTLGGYTAEILEWHRNPLKNVTNDKCYYASVDVTLDSNTILTFLFKSTKPFDTENGKSYENIISTLTRKGATQAAYTATKKVVNNSSWNAETQEAYEKYFGPNSELTWGIYEPSAPLNYLPLRSKEQAIGYQFPINIYYTHISSEPQYLEQALSLAKQNERLVELTLQTPETGSGNVVFDVLNGQYDGILYNYGKTIAASGAPVLFRLCNEMNGDWCVYSAYHTSKDAEMFIELYKYVYRVFEETGADKNTIWVWNPNEKSFPNFKWNDALCYYPGDEYVDVVGMTGYNTGTYYSDEKWREFDEIYDSLYQEYIAIYEQPLMITEFSCSKFGGDKVAWIENMFRTIDKYDRLKAAVWWDGCDWDANGNIARSYFINDVEGSMDVFRKYLNDGSNEDYNKQDGEGYI